MVEKVSITLGDPSGISPEILVKSIDKLPKSNAYIIYGSKSIIDFYIKKLDKPTFYKIIDSPDKIKSRGFYLINIYDKQFEPSKPSINSGKASYMYLKEAIKHIKIYNIKKLITLPISKENIMKAGFKYAGHTDYLANEFNTQNYAMVLMCKKLKVALITTHIPLKDVPKSITKRKIISLVKLLDKELKDKFGIKNPKFALLGLNPHSGDGGNIGKEEILVINPAVEVLKSSGINITYPLSADTAFNNHKNFDMYVAMYHDQGLIPLKLLCFKKAVNITFGLPIIRTSPDHGTGFDIAGQLKADPSSFIEAVKLANQLKTSD